VFRLDTKARVNEAAQRQLLTKLTTRRSHTPPQPTFTPFDLAIFSSIQE